MYGLPDYIEIDVAIIVNEAIAHPGDLSKRDARKVVAGLGCQAGRSFPGHQEAAQHRILRLRIPHELLARLARHVTLNRLHGVENIDQTGELSRR